MDGFFNLMKFFDSIAMGNISELEKLLDDDPGLLNVWGKGSRPIRDKSPLMFALQCHQDDVAVFLADRGGDVNAIMPGGQRIPVLHFAVHRFVEVSTLTKVLELGADPNCHDYFGWSPLKLAVCLANCDPHDHGFACVEKLVEFGADWNLAVVEIEDPDLPPTSPIGLVEAWGEQLTAPFASFLHDSFGLVPGKK